MKPSTEQMALDVLKSLDSTLEFMDWENGDGEEIGAGLRDLVVSVEADLAAKVEPVAEVIECEINGQQMVREIEGRWKFLRIGDKLYTTPQKVEAQDQLDAALKDRVALAMRVEELTAERDMWKQSADDQALIKSLVTDERDSLRAEIDQLKKQEPVDSVLLEDMVEGNHPQYGRGLFTTDNCVKQLYLAAGAQPASCEYCDGTGDIHSADGKWFGRCNCAFGRDAS